jgi:hypothetical protein
LVRGAGLDARTTQSPAGRGASPWAALARPAHDDTNAYYAAEVQSVLRPEIRLHVLCKPGRNNNRCLPPDIGLSAIAWPTAIRSTVFPWSGLLELVRDLIHYDYRDMISAMTTKSPDKKHRVDRVDPQRGGTTCRCAVFPVDRSYPRELGT